MAAMTEPELVSYFNEHVYYEMLMLRFSKQRLESKCDQLEWNVMFAAFNVSARNLYHFLTNSGDRTHVRTVDYNSYRTADFTAPKEEVKGTLQTMNAQCFHLGRNRKMEANEKIGLERIGAMSTWAVSNMGKLIQSFKKDVREKIRPGWHDLLRPGLVIRITGQLQPAASSLISSLTSGHTCSPCEITIFDAPVKS